MCLQMYGKLRNRQYFVQNTVGIIIMYASLRACHNLTLIRLAICQGPKELQLLWPSRNSHIVTVVEVRCLSVYQPRDIFHN